LQAALRVLLDKAAQHPSSPTGRAQPLRRQVPASARPAL